MRFSQALQILARTALALTMGAAAQAAVLDFEDLSPTPSGFDAVAVHAGFTFTNWYYGVDTIYPPASGRIDLFTDFADPADPGAYIISNNNAVSRVGGFYFDGAWFSGYSGVSVELWRGGSFLGSFGTLADAEGADPYGPTFLSSGYAALVDRVVISGVQGYYVMDDFTYRLPGIPAVPEPATSILFLVALATLGARGRQLSRSCPDHRWAPGRCG